MEKEKKTMIAKTTDDLRKENERLRELLYKCYKCLQDSDQYLAYAEDQELRQFIADKITRWDEVWWEDGEC